MATPIIVGWIFLVLSWIIPSFFKNDRTDGFIFGITSAAIGLGVFIGYGLSFLK